MYGCTFADVSQAVSPCLSILALGLCLALSLSIVSKQLRYLPLVVSPSTDSGRTECAHECVKHEARDFVRIWIHGFINQIGENLEQGAERMNVRLSSWDVAPAHRGLSPMPPATA